MKRPILFLLAAFLGLSFSAQEVAIFKDQRSLVIQGHREAAGWTYLRLPGGEMAVRSSELLTIVIEKGARPPAPPTPSSPAVGAPAPSFPRPAMVPERPAPPPPSDESAEEEGEDAEEEEPDDTEAEAEASATKPPDQPPKDGGDQKPPAPPGLPPPPVNMDGPVPAPQRVEN